MKPCYVPPGFTLPYACTRHVLSACSVEQEELQIQSAQDNLLASYITVNLLSVPWSRQRDHEVQLSMQRHDVGDQ